MSDAAKTGNGGKEGAESQRQTSSTQRTLMMCRSGEAIQTRKYIFEDLQTFINDCDYKEMMSTDIEQQTSHLCRSNVTHVNLDREDAVGPLTKDDVEPLCGHIIMVEGGIAQGKTVTSDGIAEVLKALGVKCECYNEPVDSKSLRWLMKFSIGNQRTANSNTTTSSSTSSSASPPLSPSPPPNSQYYVPQPLSQCSTILKEDASKSAVAIRQFTMLRKRFECSTKAVEDARNGTAVLMDRSPIGDMVFMQTTFDKFCVDPAIRLQYMTEMLSKYLRLGFPPSVIVRIKAPVEDTYARWLQREIKVDGPKYGKDYLSMIEDSYDVCCKSWGPHIVYNNSIVGTQEMHFDVAIKALILTIKDFIIQHKQKY
jgi:deoxyadenosine/deoxycytidine kinase